MIQLLTVLTVAYALVLVVVLAATLITILYYLRSIGTTLGSIAGGLEVVEGHSAPLGDRIGAINSGLSAVGAGLAAAGRELAAADGLLASALGDSDADARAA